MKNKFAEQLKKLRAERRMSQAELAEMLQVKQSCVSKWERAATLPDAEMIVRVCEALGCTADFVLGLNS